MGERDCHTEAEDKTCFRGTQALEKEERTALLLFHNAPQEQRPVMETGKSLERCASRKRDDRKEVV